MSTDSLIHVVLYPSTPDTTFNREYYLAKHIPLVHKNWTQFGLLDVAVHFYDADGAGNEPQFVCQCIMKWRDLEGQTKARQPENAAEIMGDVKKYYNKSPVILFGRDMVKA